MQLSLYSRRTIYLIVFTAVIKILLAPFIELGNDEVYYWTYALQPDWNHFDHPPMVGLLIRLTTLNLFWVNELALRIGAILSSAIATWLIYKTGKLIAGERAGWFSALMYSVSVYTGFIAGFFILPDSPQMIFWTGGIYFMACLLLQEEGHKNIKVWLMLGLMIGLACLCKIHGLYLWAGFGLLILIKRTNWLLNWRLYVSVLITILFLLPVVYWNIQNDFITYQFHSERVSHTSLDINSFIREIGGELLYQNPVVFVLIFISLFALLRKRFYFENKLTGIWLICMSLPLLLLIWVVSMLNPTLPHWSGPAYIPLFFIAGAYLDKRLPFRNWFPGVLRFALGFVCTVLIAAIFIIHFSPVNFGSQDQANYGEYCPTLDLSGWRAFGDDFSRLVKKDIKEQRMRPDAVLITNKWFPGGHIEFYVAREAAMELVGLGQLQDLHQFAWLNKGRKKWKIGDDAYCIVPSNLPFNIVEKYGPYFREIQAPVIQKQIRNGGVVRYFYIYRLKYCSKIPDLVIK